MQTPSEDIICIGSVLWDIIGRSPRDMISGNDVPGRIRRIPGGVAMNIAMTLARAVCELQEELRRKFPDLYFINKIDAPTKVGQS